MKIEVVPVEQAKAQARAARISTEQEKQITEMLQSITKDEGAKITLDDGESMGSLKSRIEKIAKAEGVRITVKTAKKKGFVIVWRTDGEK